MKAKAKRQRTVYSYSIGNCRRICCNTCIFGNEPGMFYCTSAIILIIPALFIGGVYLHILSSSSHSAIFFKSPALRCAAIVLSAACMFASFTTLFCAACSDPGIMARRTDNPNFAEERRSTSRK